MGEVEQKSSVTQTAPEGQQMRVQVVNQAESGRTQQQQEDVMRLRGGANTFADCLA